MSWMPASTSASTPVEQDRLVGDRNQLLGAGVSERAQTRAFAAAEDQTFQFEEPIILPQHNARTCFTPADAAESAEEVRKTTDARQREGQVEAAIFRNPEA